MKSSHKLSRILLLYLLTAGILNTLPAFCQGALNVKEESVKVEKQSNDFTEVVLNADKAPENFNVNLEQALNMALENNSLFNIQKKQTKIYKIRAVKSALNFLPVMNTALKYSYQPEVGDMGSNSTYEIPGVGLIDFGDIPIEDNWKRQFTVSATQPILGLYRKYHIRRMADLTFEKALLEESGSGQSLANNVYSTYFDLLASQYQLEALKESVKELQAHYDLAFNRYKHGTALKRDAQKVEVSLERAKYNVLVKGYDIFSYKNRLKSLLNLSQNDSIEVSNTYKPLVEELDYEKAVRLAIENNKRLQQMGIDINIARHAKKESYSRYIPDFDISLSYINQAGNDFMPANNMLLSFNMNYDFFDWGQRELTIKERRLQLEQANLAYNDYYQNLEVDVKDAINDVKEAKKLIEVSEKNVELAKTNVDISSNRYKVGLELISDVLTDQQDLSRARFKYYKALFDKEKSIVQLKEIMGILLLD